MSERRARWQAAAHRQRTDDTWSVTLVSWLTAGWVFIPATWAYWRERVRRQGGWVRLDQRTRDDVTDSTVEVLTQRALGVRQLYDELHQHAGRRPWTPTDFTLGLAGDVGDLARLTQVAEGVRVGDANVTAALRHELADCLWSVLVLAHLHDVDLTAAFADTMTDLERDLGSQLPGGSRGKR